MDINRMVNECPSVNEEEVEFPQIFVKQMTF